MNPYAKAITAALVTAYALYSVATGAGTPGGGGVTANEWVNLVVATIVSGLGVWAVPNSEPKPPDAVTAVRTGRSGL
jgi:hypothetical protein